VNEGKSDGIWQDNLADFIDMLVPHSFRLSFDHPHLEKTKTPILALYDAMHLLLITHFILSA
jgi:hypothetical protein